VPGARGNLLHKRILLALIEIDDVLVPDLQRDDGPEVGDPLGPLADIAGARVADRQTVLVEVDLDDLG